MESKRFDTLTLRLATGRSRRNVIGAVMGAVTALSGAALTGEGVAEAKRGGKGKKGKKKGKPKVTLCHNGQTITVGNSAVDAHLDHGDYLGPCQAFCPPGRCNISIGEVCCAPGSAMNTDSCRSATGTCCGAGGFIEGVGATCCPGGSGSSSCPTGQVCCPASAVNNCATSLSAR